MAKLTIEIESDPKLLREYARKSWKNNFSVHQSLEEENNRFIFDNFLTPEEAGLLRDFADKNTIDGEGYAGNNHPYSTNELFSCYTITHRYQEPSPGYDLALKTQYRLLRIIMNYFENHEIELYFCQLVKRISITDSSSFEKQLWSHPFHEDVNPVDDVARTHTAVLYFNEDCDGGNFIFQKNKYAPQRVVEPCEGRLVGFSAPGTIHGISHIYSGTRYAFTFWFTIRGMTINK